MQSVARSLTESLIVIAKLLEYYCLNSARNAAQRPQGIAVLLATLPRLRGHNFANVAGVANERCLGRPLEGDWQPINVLHTVFVFESRSINLERLSHKINSNDRCGPIIF